MVQIDLDQDRAWGRTYNWVQTEDEETMSITGLRQFDDTIHTTNIWLKHIMERFDWTERQDAYRALRVTLHTIRDHLPTETIAHLSAQLPTLIRGVFFEGWRPGRDRAPDRSLEAFINPISEAFQNSPEIDAERVAQVVFETMRLHISRGEIEHIEQALPKKVRRLFKNEDPRS